MSIIFAVILFLLFIIIALSLSYWFACLSHSYASIYAVRHKEKTVLAFANYGSKSCSYLSSFFGIINTVTDDNNSRVAYAFHSFLFYHQKWSSSSHILFSVLHVSSSSWFQHYNPCSCSYPMTVIHLMCHRRMRKNLFVL